MKVFIKVIWLLLLLVACNWQRCTSLQTDSQAGILDTDYHLGGQKLSWHAANYYCTNNNMQLVSIHSLKESVHLMGFLQYYNVSEEYYWTSGNRLYDQSTWNWGINGTQLDYLNWKPGRPVSSSSNYCFRLSAIDSTWYDVSCNLTYDYICQKIFT